MKTLTLHPLPPPHARPHSHSQIELDVFIMDHEYKNESDAIKVAPTASNGVMHHEVAGLHHAGKAWEAREPYGPVGTFPNIQPSSISWLTSVLGFRGLFSNHYVALCAAFATIGGLLFGYDQGVISVTLVMDQFLGRFPRVSETASGAGFWKGLMTAMLELGALVGALFAGYLADRISRKYSIVVAVIIFTTGSVLQTAAMEYAMLTVGRFIGRAGIGM